MCLEANKYYFLTFCFYWVQESKCLCTMIWDYITVSQNFVLKCSVHPKICLTEDWGEKMRSLPVLPGRSGPWPKHCREESQVLDAPPALPPARWSDLRLSPHGSRSQWLVSACTRENSAFSGNCDRVGAGGGELQMHSAHLHRHQGTVSHKWAAPWRRGQGVQCPLTFLASPETVDIQEINAQVVMNKTTLIQLAN